MISRKDNILILKRLKETFLRLIAKIAIRNTETGLARGKLFQRLYYHEIDKRN